MAAGPRPHVRCSYREQNLSLLFWAAFWGAWLVRCGCPPDGPCPGRRHRSSPAPSARACYHLVATGDRATGTGGHVQAPCRDLKARGGGQQVALKFQRQASDPRTRRIAAARCQQHHGKTFVRRSCSAWDIDTICLLWKGPVLGWQGPGRSSWLCPQPCSRSLARGGRFFSPHQP